MGEDLLYYAWLNKAFDKEGLFTTEGETVEIVKYGMQNHDAGPDFTQARIKIGDTLWAGNVEMHLHTTDWNAHGHQHDAAYKNLILHVVYEHKGEELPNNIPVLELKDHIDKQVIDKYRYLTSSKAWIPCEPLITDVPDIIMSSTMDRMAIERLEQKTRYIFTLLEQSNNSWEEAMYQLTARYFGLRANRDSFELLARSLPHKILGKHKDKLTHIEALIFGQAGFLDEEMTDDYQRQLRKEFGYLRSLHQLQPLETHIWKFSKMRPASFPTVRLAQFAMLIHRSSHLFSHILATEDVKELRKLFKSNASEYWDTHYRFGHTSIKRKKEPGKAFIDLIILNVVVPMLFAYGTYKAADNYKDRALKLLENLPAEKNSVLDKWASVRHKAQNTLESQALIQLKNEHCDHKQCLKCSIGASLMKHVHLF